MLYSYIKIAFRNLRRNKLFSILNVLGLSAGMACSILIFLWVADERSYDRFHKDASHIYRITAQVNDIKSAVVPVPLAMAVKEAFPEVKMVTRVVPLQSMVTIGARKFEDKQILYADSNFLQLFSFPMANGGPAPLFKDPGTVLLTESGARKYFDSPENAIGKTLHIDNDYTGNDLMVTAILKDIPVNSHLQFDMVLPIQLYERTINLSQGWGNYDLYSYILFAPAFNPTKNAIAGMEKRIMQLHEQLDDSHTKATLRLQALTDIHLSPGLMLDVAGQGNRQQVNTFSLVAIFILLIACINFMNLSTALSAGKAKEVGLRKAIGAKRSQLVFQFLTEAILLSFISLGLGLALAWLLTPLFNQLTGKAITLPFLSVNWVGMLIGGVLLLGLIAGSYPSLLLSSFLPVKVLKGAKVMHGNRSFFRSSLIVVQFSIAVILIISTIVVYRQLTYIQKRDIGFNKNDLVYAPIPRIGDLVQHCQALKTAVAGKAGLEDVTFISHLPTDLTTGTKFVNWEGKDPLSQPLFCQMWVDYHFAQTFKMQLVSGRFFREDAVADKNNLVVNEAALKILGVDANSALGKKVTIGGAPAGEIVGVLKDFNFKPVQQPIQPLLLRNANDGNFNGNNGYVVVRTGLNKLPRVEAGLQAAFQKTFGDFPFTMGFISQDLEHLYLTEQRMGKLFNIFSVLAILVSCLGLFGLTTYATQQRIREIGIRKVLGASVTSIVGMLSKDFILLVLLALLIGFPLAYWMMQRWLSHFVYHISIEWWIFVVAGISAILVAFLTMSFQSVKAARANPVKSLKAE